MASRTTDSPGLPMTTADLDKDTEEHTFDWNPLHVRWGDVFKYQHYGGLLLFIPAVVLVGEDWLGTQHTVMLLWFLRSCCPDFAHLGWQHTRVQQYCTTSVPSWCGCLQVSPTSPSKIGQWCAKPCCMTQPSGVCSSLSGPSDAHATGRDC